MHNSKYKKLYSVEFRLEK